MRVNPTPRPAPTVACPHCQAPVRFEPSARWRPFCSARCREADLGAWASESFRIPAAPPTDDPDAAVD